MKKAVALTIVVLVALLLAPLIGQALIAPQTLFAGQLQTSNAVSYPYPTPDPYPFYVAEGDLVVDAFHFRWKARILIEDLLNRVFWDMAQQVERKLAAEPFVRLRSESAIKRLQIVEATETRAVGLTASGGRRRARPGAARVECLELGTHLGYAEP